MNGSVDPANSGTGLAPSGPLATPSAPHQRFLLSRIYCRSLWAALPDTNSGAVHRGEERHVHIRPLSTDDEMSVSFEAAANEINIDFRRRMAAVRHLTRHERAHAIKALRDMREASIAALKRRANEKRHAARLHDAFRQTAIGLQEPRTVERRPTRYTLARRTHQWP